MRAPINELIQLAASPAILEARAWLENYDGNKGAQVDLSQAAPPYLPALELTNCLSRTASIPDLARYGPVSGEHQLRSAYAQHTSQLYGASISPEHVAITAGCNQGFFIAAMSVAQSGDAMIICTPYYFNHKMTLDMLGITAIEAVVFPERQYVPEPSVLASLINDRVKAIVIVTPNNPTGSIYPTAVIEEIGKLCQAFGIWLIIDETYRDFLPDGQPHTLLKSQVRENVISLYSFSKSLALPGYRVGAMIFPVRLAESITKLQDCIQICPARVGQVGVAWAIEHLAEWKLEKRKQLFNQATNFCRVMEAAPSWHICSIGAYFAYLRHPFENLTSKDVAKRLASENGLLLIPGSYFGSGQERYLRLSFGNLSDEALKNLPVRFRL